MSLRRTQTRRLHTMLYILQITREWKTAETWFLAKLFIYQSSIVYQILDFIHWMFTILVLITWLVKTENKDMFTWREGAPANRATWLSYFFSKLTLIKAWKNIFSTKLPKWHQTMSRRRLLILLFFCAENWILWIKHLKHWVSLCGYHMLRGENFDPIWSKLL